MAIIAGQDILASDFIDTSAGAGDSGKATKLNASGKLDNTFLEVGFGGSGLDGALNVTSGTTTIDAGNARVVVKNYTSINISNGATLTLSNPATDGTVLILKCQGNCTIDGAIDLVGMGASESTSGFNLLDSDDHFGANGTNNSGGSAAPIIPLPESYALNQNYPNPFNPKTTIKYELPNSGDISLKIYNVTGQLVKTLVDNHKEAGYHTIEWNGDDENGRSVASGIYIYRLINNEGIVNTKKMIMVK